MATFGYLAALTKQVRFATHVLVLGYHHPLEMAKRYGTLDVVSGGRLILGVGVGSLREEFELLGAPFPGRGPRADDALAALRASLSQDQPVHNGPYYDYAGFIVQPCAVQERVPLWVGGRTRRSLRRAATLADGWAPFGVSLDDVAGWLADADRPSGFEIVVGPEQPLDLGGRFTEGDHRITVCYLDGEPGETGRSRPLASWASRRERWIACAGPASSVIGPPGCSEARRHVWLSWASTDRSRS